SVPPSLKETEPLATLPRGEKKPKSQRKFILCKTPPRHFHYEGDPCDRPQPIEETKVTFERIGGTDFIREPIAEAVLPLNPFAAKLAAQDPSSNGASLEVVGAEKLVPISEEIGKCYDCMKYHPRPMHVDGSGGPCPNKLDLAL